jgi:hypothetical protein
MAVDRGDWGSQPAVTGYAQKSGLAKAATVFAIVLVVSIGLCGVNMVAVMSAHNGQTQKVLMFTAYSELLGMVVGALGLIVVGIIAVVRAIFFRDTPGSQSGD